MYEYKKTGVAKLDEEEASKNLYGITVPIITAETTEEGRNNPRAPFYAVYKFILDDLASAEELLSDYQRPTKNLPCTCLLYTSLGCIRNCIYCRFCTRRYYHRNVG